MNNELWKPNISKIIGQKELALIIILMSLCVLSPREGASSVMSLNWNWTDVCLKETYEKKYILFSN